jgi:hypothetical protein
LCSGARLQIEISEDQSNTERVPSADFAMFSTHLTDPFKAFLSMATPLD